MDRQLDNVFASAYIYFAPPTAAASRRVET
jgi:hypothetical protein